MQAHSVSKSVWSILASVCASVLFTGVAAAQEQAPAYPRHAVPRLQGVTIEGLPAVTGRICVDQFGYLPQMTKVAVVSDPQKGYNAGDHYTPGDELQVRRKSDGQVVFKGAPAAWKNGEVSEDSGDRGWWFDFSEVKTPGEYYVFDPSTQLRSPVFRVAEDVYYPILRAAVRMYYFQRENLDLVPEYVEGPWADAAAVPGFKQARAVWAKDDPTTARDLTGGWMDAGDTNKYPPFLGEVIHPLLYAYEHNPRAFGDDYNIPESGNGIPDVLDEIRWEMDWLKKAQAEDGGVFIKMGEIDHNSAWPLSNDKRPRYYGPESSGSTLWTAGSFAHVARVFGKFDQLKPYAADLQDRALKAWAWYESHPRDYKTDTGEIKSGLANRSADEHDRMEAFAAVHLFALTGDEKFHKVIRERAKTSRQLSEGIWSPYEAGSAEALLDYARMEQADPALRDQIRQQLTRSAADRNWAPPADANLYRSWITLSSYHWGSNTQRANNGTVALQAAANTDLPEAEKARLTIRAADMLHSFHGINPLSAVYLTNMDKLGAERSMTRFYHQRWGFSSKFYGNPPPGYVVGGACKGYDGKSRNNDGSLDWIHLQPPAKAYADFGPGWPEASYMITEPGIYYQALYIRLLSSFVSPPRK